ncbi:MAG TPA: hypothetical protein VND40_01255 [Nitrososphaerales archaeon]|nr:hypothetical protein [Nitrososphaerales archaeon]
MEAVFAVCAEIVKVDVLEATVPKELVLEVTLTVNELVLEVMMLEELAPLLE